MIADLDLPAHGLRIVQRKVANFLPLNDREYLLTGEGRTKAEVAKFSAFDAERLPAYGAAAGGHRRGAARPGAGDAAEHESRAAWRAALPGAAQGGGRWGGGMSRLDLTARRDLLALFAQSAGDWLDGWFESDPIKAVLGFDGVVGNYASPYTPGSAYVLLHHVFGEVNGKKGAWGHAIGGMGAITQAMAKACAAAGVDIRLGDGAARGAGREGSRRRRGDRAAARRSAPRIGRVQHASQDPVRAGCWTPAMLPPDFRERIHRYRSGSGTFRMNVALSELPRFTCLPDAGDAPDRRHHHGAQPSPTWTGPMRTPAPAAGRKEPIVEMLIPSTLDDSLAPQGRHVASLFCQHVAPELPDGRSWDDHREEVADLMIDTVDRFAPGFKASVLGRQALTPLDLERNFGLIGGDIFHGKLELDQLFSARPVLGHGAYRAPIAGLYLCGAGTHPGGGVTGAPGHNAAREILQGSPTAARRAHEASSS